MHPYSLSFLSEDLEMNYQEHKVKSHLGVFGKNLLFFGVIASSVSIYAFLYGNWQVGIYALTYPLVLVPTLYLLATSFQRYFNMICFAFQLAVTVSVPFVYIMNLIKPPIQDCDSYLTGQLIILMVQSFNLGANFQLKGLVIMLNIFTQLSFELAKKQEITCLNILWLGSNFMIFNYVYWNDRSEKEAFLIKHNERIWQKEIGSCAKICIISCVTEAGRLLLDHKKCNQITQSEFRITDQDSFKQFLNDVKLVQKSKFNQQTLNDMKSPNKSKNKNFVSLFNKIHKISEKNLIDNSGFIGLHRKSIYDINIFTTWSNQQQNIHILITKSLTQTEREISCKLEYERASFAQYRQQIKSTIRRILTKFRQINLNKQSQVIFGSFMSDIHDLLRMNNNIQLFHKPLFEQSRIGFFLLPFLKQLKTIIMISMPYPFKLTVNCSPQPDIRLFQCQKTLSQILFNLLSIIVGPAKKCGYIDISAKQSSNRIGNYVTFIIATNIVSIQNILDCQNYQKSLYGENNGFYLHNKKVGIDVIVSEYLIGKIGPLRRIKFENFSQERQLIRFSIYQDLESSMI